MELLERKKSKLLADLLVQRKDNDILFEEFTEYESYFQECLNSPDEVFELRDNEGDYFFVYMKSHIQENKRFSTIIPCLKRKDRSDDQSVILFPVLAFPTNDLAIYLSWKNGRKIPTALLNIAKVETMKN